MNVSNISYQINGPLRHSTLDCLKFGFRSNETRLMTISCEFTEFIKKYDAKLQQARILTSDSENSSCVNVLLVELEKSCISN